ncbi:MAG: methyltransferase domain-containing protein [Muribaculaceae bacterium]|nr:methyltransferase domain-containing protein [Muribaculaceae bacterium]
MNLSESLKRSYCQDKMTALDAQRYAEFLAFAPIAFQTARIMVKRGLLRMIGEQRDGMTIAEVAEKGDLSVYAAKCLMEAALSIGLLIVDAETDRFKLTKAGWFLDNDVATGVNMHFNHDVNYLGMFHLEEALTEGRPAGLKTLGDWTTIYEGLSMLPGESRKSWFDFDHFYSDSSFDDALKIVFSYHPKTLLDVGGNTGRWALRCVEFDKDVEVTIVDLPKQIALMERNIEGIEGANRIKGLATDLLDEKSSFPEDIKFDAVWMSQFLDCFSERQIVDILKKAVKVMTPDSRLFIMETLWDRQRFETAAMCLTLTSLYFTAMANGNSKMYHSDDMKRLINEAGLEVEAVHDHLGQGHTILVCKLKNSHVADNNRLI